MVEAIRPSLFTVPFGQDLCDAAVSAIFDRASASPLALSQCLIFLPNNRAIRTLTDAFVRRATPGLLLPHMVAIGDLDLNQKVSARFDPFGSTADVLPVITPMQRLFLLAKLVGDDQRASGKPKNANEAIRLARYLANVIDELEIEQVRFGRFEEIEPGGDLAGHWHASYARLLRLVPRYQSELSGLKLQGPAERRNALLYGLAASLRQEQPKFLIASVGVSTAAPAIAQFLRTITGLPNAMVILPAVDLAMSEQQWDRLIPAASPGPDLALPVSNDIHPQFHLKLLIDRMGFRREEIALIGKSNTGHGAAISEIFSLADETEHWRDLPDKAKRLPNTRLLVAQDTAEEARAIAVLVRGALETPQKRIAVVTPDRELALRVSAQLKRWNINVDDSAGSPLIQSPNGSLFIALAQAIADDFTPVSLLAVLKHPLVMAGDARLDWLENVRMLDFVLRGPSSGVGLLAITGSIDNWLASRNNKHSDKNSRLSDWWTSVSGELTKYRFDELCKFGDLVAAVQSLAETLTGGAIWRGEAGRELSAFTEELGMQNLSDLGTIDREAIVGLFAELMDGIAVRAPYGGHPRVAIFGLLEARLQQSDVVICAGMNEGGWPGLPGPDPWLAPRIRRELKLSGLQRNIGLSAHDLATALGASEVILTRARRDRNGPTIASRFLLRMQAFLGENLQRETTAINFAQLLDTAPDEHKYIKPAPVPSLEQRAKINLSITDFDRLLSDPYSFYANKILNLKTLDPVDALPSHAWRGSAVHEILEKWAKEDDCDPEKLNARARELLANPAVHPALRALWQPRVAQGLRWVAEKTADLAREGRTLLVAEAWGETEIEGVIVRGRADRIDRLADGGLAIVDYKTGAAPTNASIFNGFALQLGLIGYMVEAGGISKAKGNAAAFEYWSLAKKAGTFGAVSAAASDTVKKNKIGIEEFVSFTLSAASEAIRRWIKDTGPFTAKLHPEYAPYADYDQLMRFDEWNGREPLPDGDNQ
jgi:ATP-dependent helicase/nuclease subunit B